MCDSRAISTVQLPTSVASPDERFYCERFQVTGITGKECVKRRRAGFESGCRVCKTGRRHEELFGHLVEKAGAKKQAPWSDFDGEEPEFEEEETMNLKPSISEIASMKLRVREAMKERGLSIVSATRQIGISDATFYNKNWSEGTAAKIEAWLASAPEKPRKQAGKRKDRFPALKKPAMPLEDDEDADDEDVKTPGNGEPPNVRLLSDDYGSLLYCEDPRIAIHVGAESRKDLGRLFGGIENGSLDPGELARIFG